MNNITNKTKTILFASLIAAMILPFSVMDYAEAKTDDKSVKQLLKGLEKDVKQYVKQAEKMSKQDKKSVLKEKHRNSIDKVLQKLEKQSGKKLDKDEVQNFHAYVITESLKHAEIENAYSQSDVIVESETIHTDGEWTIIPEASASHSSSNQYLIYYFKQPLVDKNGGSGFDGSYWPYSVNGDNYLQGVDKIVSSSQSMTRYILEWHDEDHPIPESDIIYDAYRQATTGRIADVETFVVLNGVIQFDDIWDSDKTYAYPIGSHGDKDRTFYNGVKIYANTWNHALDIYDNNSGMTKYTKYF